MEEVIQILEVIANPNPEHLKAAEARLEQAKASPGFTVLMLQIVLCDNNLLSTPARALSSIIFKQAVETHWSPHDKKIPEISPQDKAIIRENAVNALLHCHPEVTAQLREAMKTIISADWPERWPELIPRVLDVLKTQQNPRVLEGALLCYCTVVKKGEWTGGSSRASLNELVEQTFPFIYDFLCHARTINTAESYNLQKIICRTFYAAFQMKMSPYLKKDEVLGPWLAKFMEILMAPLPDNQPELENPGDWSPWKAKKWCMHIFNRLFIRFGDPMLSKKKEKKQWANNFSKNYATKILEGVLQIIDLKRKGMLIPKALLGALFRFVTTSVLHSSTWPIISPYCPTMIVEVLIPLVSFSDDDERTWKEDPAEYIRKEYDILEEYHSVKSAVIDLICTLVRLRSAETLRFLLDMLVNIFNQYKAAPDTLKNPRRVEGALNIFGSISEEFMESKIFVDSLDALVAEHVLPHMDSPIPFIVARSCLCFGRYSTHIETSNLIVEGIKRVLNVLKHPELPTRVQAALALRSLVATDEAKPLLKNVLPDLFQIMFSLINEIDSDDLVFVLDNIIFEFKDSIGPYAVSICGQLTRELFRFSAAFSDDEECESAFLAAVECGSSLVTVLSSVRKTPELYPEIFQVISPFINNSIEKAHDELTGYALQALSFISYFIPKPLPPQLWSYFHVVLVDDFPVTYIEELVPFLDNMITRDPQGFLEGRAPSGVRYLDLMGNMLVSTLDKEGEEGAGGEALKLMEVMFQSCGGAIDGLVPVSINLVLSRLSKTIEDPNFKVLLFTTMGNILFYNPALTLQTTESKGLTGNFVGAILETVEQEDVVKRIYDRKQVSLGLTSLLRIPVSELPQNVASLIPNIVMANIKLLTQINEKLTAKFERQEKKKEVDENELLQGVLSEQISFIRNDDVDDDDEEDVSVLVQQIQEYEDGDGTVIGYGDEDSDDDDDDYDPDDDDDDENYESSLSAFDKIDQLAFFMEHLKGMQREPQIYQQLIEGLPEGQRAQLGKFEAEVIRRQQGENNN